MWLACDNLSFRLTDVADNLAIQRAVATDVLALCTAQNKA